MGASHAAEDKEDSICPYQERYALWKGSSRKAHSRRSLSLSQKKFSTKQNFSNQRAVKEDYVRSAVKIVEWSILKILISTMQGKLSDDDDSSQKEKCSVAFKWSWRRNHIYLRWQHQHGGAVNCQWITELLNLGKMYQLQSPKTLWLMNQNEDP